MRETLLVIGLLLIACCAMWGQISECIAKGGELVYSTCVKKDAIL